MNLIMENCELKKWGVQELNEEMREVNGGVLPALIAIIGAGIYIYNNWDDFADGFAEGYNK
jgi:hypothetical protein